MITIINQHALLLWAIRVRHHLHAPKVLIKFYWRVQLWHLIDFIICNLFNGHFDVTQNITLILLEVNWYQLHICLFYFLTLFCLLTVQEVLARAPKVVEGPEGV